MFRISSVIAIANTPSENASARAVSTRSRYLASVTVVLGGGIGANADLLLEPVRVLLADWLPYPPRVEVSSLGEAAHLTGALALGRKAALDNVFVNARARGSDGRKAKLH